jgi:hypothetical protein
MHAAVAYYRLRSAACGAKFGEDTLGVAVLDVRTARQSTGEAAAAMVALQTVDHQTDDDQEGNQSSHGLILTLL